MEEQSDEDERLHEAHGSHAGDAERQNEGEGTAIKRRLRTKTNPSQAPGFPTRELLKLGEFRIRQHKLKKAKAKRDTERRAVRQRAIELLARQPPGAAMDIDEWSFDGPITNPHSSHRILALHGNSDTIFCKNCSCWASKAKLRLLATPCQGIRVGSKSTLRLLECGVLPIAGAKLPTHLKKRHGRIGRRCRW